ncbi:MAG: PT domain-containing protein [Rickettsiales bacterium]
METSLEASRNNLKLSVCRAKLVVEASSTGFPSLAPTVGPTSLPSNNPSLSPSSSPSKDPSSYPSESPLSRPTGHPTAQPTGQPSGEPTGEPTVQPSGQPLGQPSVQPSEEPTSNPSVEPSVHPSGQPTNHQSGQPTGQTIGHPTGQPSDYPSGKPTNQPTDQPSAKPSETFNSCKISSFNNKELCKSFAQGNNIYVCNDSINIQEWYFMETGDGDDSYFIVQKNTDETFYATYDENQFNSVYTNGTYIDANDNNRKWFFVKINDGIYSIENKGSGKRVTLENSNRNGNKDQLYLYDKMSGDNSQKWSLESCTGEININIINPDLDISSLPSPIKLDAIGASSRTFITQSNNTITAPKTITLDVEGTGRIELVVSKEISSNITIIIENYTNSTSIELPVQSMNEVIITDNILNPNLTHYLRRILLNTSNCYDKENCNVKITYNKGPVIEIPHVDIDTVQKTIKIQNSQSPTFQPTVSPTINQTLTHENDKENGYMFGLSQGEVIGIAVVGSAVLLGVGGYTLFSCANNYHSFYDIYKVFPE